MTCSADQTLTTDTSGTDVNGSCTNKAGLSTDAAPLTVKLDKSQPDRGPLDHRREPSAPNGWYVDDVTVHTSGADNVSDPTICTDDQFQTDDTTGADLQRQLHQRRRPDPGRQRRST